ncbi:MAG: alpha/beta hydrolase [Cellvibrionaceae bacterium]|nr:alpha/beta hydrolase [Cellvibrionaceae bacterium]|tara:strand:- start:3883 stop:4827 length:945 start_codon:yes stop_codon:yes gene_type:complete
MSFSEAAEVERYMRSEAALLLAHDASEFVTGLRESVDRIFLSADNKPTAMHSVLEMEPGTKTTSTVIDGIDCEWVYADGADFSQRLLYLHGGGMVAGSAKTHRAMISRIATRTNTAILVPNYQLAPENPFPAAPKDAITLVNWLWKNSPQGRSAAQKLFLAGDSAGGGLVLSLLVNYRNEFTTMPDAAATFSAVCDFGATSPSMTLNAESDALLSKEAIQGLGHIYGDGVSLSDPLISPLNGDIDGLPPLHMQVSDSEVLLNDTSLFFEKHKANGGLGELRIYSNMVHVWQAFSPYLPEANEALDDLAKFFHKH